jgi:hypothetical protein
MANLRAWAQRTFGKADLGDKRLNRRLVEMAGSVAEAPAGLVSEVFRKPSARQAAYDFLEHDRVSVAGPRDALFQSTAEACADHESVLAVIDGSSLSLRDKRSKNTPKDFGAIGNWSHGVKGLKVVSALVMTGQGAPLGIAAQVWWARQERAVDNTRYRSASARESVHWRTAVDELTHRFASHAPQTKLHVVADREADASLFIAHLLELGHEFTIRSNATRKVMVAGRRRNLRRILQQRPVCARARVELRATSRRSARVAHLEIRAARLPLVLRDRHHKSRRTVDLSVVWARERGRSPSRGGLDWVLITTADVKTPADALATITRYTYRWRIEDFHKSWKSGVCRVEETQLRSSNAVIKWATILAAVATRAERLRQRARTQPNILASVELTADELEALVLLRHDRVVDDHHSPSNLTLATAVRWIADLGGYVGARSSGQPGATTITRGLEQVVFAARVLAAARRTKMG